MGILLFFIANLVVLACAVLLTKNMKIASTSDRVLAVIVVFISQILLSELVLGVFFKRLYRLELLGLNILILAVLAAVHRKHLAIPRKISTVKIKSFIAGMGSSPLLLILTVLCLMEIIYIIYAGLNLPPFGWDEIWYHLTAVASWHQEGRIGMLPMPSLWSDPHLVSTLTPKGMAYHMSIGGFWYNVYPMNSELISLWNVIFLGNDSIVDLTELFFSLTGVIAIYSLGIKLGSTQNGAATAGLMFLVTPIVIIQSKTAYVDITFSVMTIAVINFITGFAKNRNISHALMAAAASGILLGTKVSGIAFAGAFVLLLLVLDCLNNGTRYNFSRFLKHVSIFGIITLTLGGFWYLRNLYYFGNPIYPYVVKIGGATIFPGLGTVENLIMRHNTPPEYINSPNFINVLTSWFERATYYSVDIRKAGFGPLWIILELPSIIFLAIIALKDKMKTTLAVMALFALLFMIHPSNWWTRYTIFIVALGTISFAFVLERFGRLTRTVVSGSVVLLALYTFLMAFPYLFPENITDIIKIPVEKRTIGSTMFSDFAWADGVPKGTKIGYAPMTFTYPLFSKNFKNKVYLVDGNTSKEWVDKISSSKVQYVTFLKGYLSYDKWIKEYPDRFKEIYDGREVKVYEVVRVE